MNKQLIVSVLAGTTAILCGLAQEQPDRRQDFNRQNPPNNGPDRQMDQQRPGCPMQGGMGGQCPMRQQQDGMDQQGPQMRGMANQGRQMPGEPTPRRLFADPAALKAAGATDEQIQAFRKSMQDFRMKQIDLRANVEKAELNMQMLESDPKSDEVTLLKATDEVSKARAELLRQETLMKTKPKSIFGEEIVMKLFESSQKKQSQRPQPPQGGGDRQGQKRQGACPRAQSPAGPAQK